MNSSLHGSYKFNKSYQRLLVRVWFLQDQSHSWLLVLLICVWFNKPRHKATLAWLQWVNWMHEESLCSYFTPSIHSNQGADWRVKTSCSCFHKQFLLLGFAEQQLARDVYMVSLVLIVYTRSTVVEDAASNPTTLLVLHACSHSRCSGPL